ncbi:MAG: response regulator [Oculatellaceae cyanobacterium Prado106]|jgi:CheY-like chemotaxis protein|nr:response regulator [Oculatellaceae cyanobacterium Prado106]
MAKILVLEDNLLGLDLLQSLLTLKGHEVLFAMDGRSGLEQIRVCQPDLVISDVDMPEMNGLEVLQHLRQNPTTATLPVIIYTSADEGIYRNTVKQLQAAYLTKPFEINEMMAIVTQQLEGGFEGGSEGRSVPA